MFIFINMTSCQACYCTNEKGKCEKIVLCVIYADHTLVKTSINNHENTGKHARPPLTTKYK